jgi:hypothetical protein
MAMRAFMSSLELLIATRRERALMKEEAARDVAQASEHRSTEEAAAEPSPRPTA